MPTGRRAGLDRRYSGRIGWWSCCDSVAVALPSEIEGRGRGLASVAWLVCEGCGGQVSDVSGSLSCLVARPRDGGRREGGRRREWRGAVLLVVVVVVLVRCELFR